MPELSTIESLKETINNLGDEPAVLAEAGVALEDIAPPEPELSEDLDELLDDDIGEIDNLEERLTQDEGDGDIFNDMDSLPSTDMSDSLDLPEGQLDLNPEDLPEEAEGLDLAETGDGELEDLDGNVDMPETGQDLGGLDDLGDAEDLGGLDDLGDAEDLDGLDDLGGAEDPGGLDDLGGAEDLGGLDDLGSAEDLGGLDNLGDAGDLGGEEIQMEEAPDIGGKLQSLSEELEESELSGDLDEDLSVSDDFGLNELGDDFLEDFEEDEGEGSFSLDDLGQEFSLEEESDTASSLAMDLDNLEKSMDEASDESREEIFELSSEEMELLKEALYPLPRNLKLELEDFMADPTTEVEELNRIIDMLLKRAPINRVASSLGKVRGKKIQVPRGYQKLNVEEFQREQNSLVNQFKEKVLPFTMAIIAGFLAILALFLIIFNFVYRPIKATILYKTGSEMIALDEYDQGDYYFDQAYFGWKIGSFSVKGWPRKEWFYNYAEAYKDRRKYDRAAEKYRILLNAYPDEKQARLDYADLLVNNMARYEEAEKILLMASPFYLEEVERGMRTLDEVPVQEIAEIRDYDLLLALGDTYFLWGESDPARYEDARYIYAYIMSTLSGRDEIVLRMFRYFLRMNNREEIERLILLFKDKEKIYTEPGYQAEIYSEVAGWLLDQKRNAEAEIFLRQANEADKTVPDVHYQYGRYFRNMRSISKEKDALTNALGYLARLDTAQKKYIYMKIDSYQRLGDIYLRQGDTSQAEKDYLMALSIFEDSQKRNLIGSSYEIGELYSKIGDLNYREHRDYETALTYYSIAGEHSYAPPDVLYRMGYIYYSHEQNYERALLQFYRTLRALPRDRNVMFAMANTLYKREDYFGAVSHYERLLRDLREEEQSIGLLVPDQKEEHLALLILLMKVYNNLGTAQYKAAERSPNRSRVSESLSYFTYSSEYYDRITRDRDTMIRSENTDMAYQNRMTVLKDRNERLDGEDVIIYEDLQTEMGSLPLFY